MDNTVSYRYTVNSRLDGQYSGWSCGFRFTSTLELPCTYWVFMGKKVAPPTLQKYPVLFLS